MSFPEWGFSYNALYVPLPQWGWQCALMPTREVQEVDRSWALSYEERKKRRKEQKEQMEQDRKDFERFFKVRIDRRDAASSLEFRTYIGFVKEHLLVSGFGLPDDGEGITRVLCNAVRDGHLVPVIDRAWHGGQRVARHYAPQIWKQTANGGNDRRSAKIYTAAEFSALRHANGETGGFGRLAQNARLDGTRNIAADAGNSSFDWAGIIESAGGAMLGNARSNDINRSDSMLRSLGGGDSAGSDPLGDAQPFEYEPNALSVDTIDIAVRGIGEANEAACFAQYERDMDECRAYRSAMGGARFMDACSQRAFQNYQQCRGY